MIIKLIKKVKPIHWIFIVFLILYHSVLLYFHATSSLTPDEPTHALISIFYREVFFNLPKLGFNISNIFSFGINYLLLYPKIQITYPPMFHILTGLISYSIFGVTAFAGRFTSTAFSFGTLILIFLITRKLFNEKIALLTSVLFAFSPYALIYSGAFMMDFTAYFFVFLSFYIFLIALEKKEYKWFIFLGITSFLSAMSKRPAILFSVFVFIYLLLKKLDKKKILVFIITFGLLITPYAFVMYKIGGIDITWHVVQTYGIEQGEPALFSLYNWTFYLNGSYPILVELLLLIFFAYYIYRKEKNWKMFFLFSLVFYIGLSIPQNKEYRFAQYIFFPMFITFSYYAFKIKEKIRSVQFHVLLSTFLIGYLLLSIPVSMSFLQHKPIKETVEYVFQNLPKGANIAMISENGNFAASSLMVYMSQMDKNKIIQVFRPCAFDKMSLDEILSFCRENNVYYMISSNPATQILERRSQNISNSNSFELKKTIGEAKIYRLKNFTFYPIKIRKNYICILRKWIFENTTLDTFTKN